MPFVCGKVSQVFFLEVCMYNVAKYYTYAFPSTMSEMAKEIILSFDSFVVRCDYGSGYIHNLSKRVKDYKVETNNAYGFVKSINPKIKDKSLILSYTEIPQEKIQELIDEIAHTPYLLDAVKCDFVGFKQVEKLLVLCEKLEIPLMPISREKRNIFDHAARIINTGKGLKGFSENSSCLIWKFAFDVGNSALKFLKFRNIDVISGLKERGIDLNTFHGAHVPSAMELLPIIDDRIDKNSNNDILSLEQLSRIEIPYLKDEILRFYDGGYEEFECIDHNPNTRDNILNFHDAFHYVYDKVSDKAKKATSPKVRHEDELICTTGNYKDYDYFLGFCLSIGEVLGVAYSNDCYDNILKFKTLLSHRTITYLDEHYQALYYVWLISQNLLKQGAFSPQFYFANEEYFRIRQIPALFNPVVKALTLNLGRCINHFHRDFYKGPNIEDFALGCEILSAFISLTVSKTYTSGKDIYFTPDFDYLTPTFARIRIDSNDEEKEYNETCEDRLDGYFNSINRDFSKYGAVLKVYERGSKDLETYVKKNREKFDGTYVGRSYNHPELYNTDDIDLGVADLGVDDLFIEVVMKGEEGKLITYDDLTINNELIYKRCLYAVNAFCQELHTSYLQNIQFARVEKEKLLDFFTRVIPCLKKIGFEVELPESLQSFATPDLNISVNLPSNVSFNAGDSFISLAQLLEFDWHLSIGDKFISDEDFEYLASHLDTLVKFNDSLVYMTEASYQDLLKRREKIDKRQPTGLKLLSAAISGSYENTEVNIGENLDKVLKELFKFTQESVPTSINATLREYQVRGFNWLLQNARVGIGSIIADDMGLGKTLQVISLIQKLKDDGEITSKLPVLVVVPTVLLINWQHELRKFAPTLSYEVIYGANAELPKECPDILLTTYGKMRSEIAKFKKKKYRLIVIDEAQAIKNKDTDTRKALCKLDAISCVAMTGTPVENRLSEYWSIMDFVNKGLLGTSTSFNNEFAKPIEKERDPFAIEHFNRLTKPFILRRLKSDKSIINDLPDKLTSNRYCSLTVEQAAMYQKLLDEQMAVIEDKSSSASASIERSSAVLALITGLKQICNGPSNYDKDYDDNVDFSGKGQMLIDVVESQIEADNKVIIFTQFVTTGELIQKWLKEKLNITADFIKGDLNVKKRQEMVDKFQNDDETKVLVLSLKAAGVGLNLTAASTVIHYDLWWNPAVENQATDRAYRIGQTHNVNVVRLICANTFEERIDDMLEAKKDLANLTVAVGESWISKLSTEEIKDIFKLA